MLEPGGGAPLSGSLLAVEKIVIAPETGDETWQYRATYVTFCSLI